MMKQEVYSVCISIENKDEKNTIYSTLFLDLDTARSYFMEKCKELDIPGIIFGMNLHVLTPWNEEKQKRSSYSFVVGSLISDKIDYMAWNFGYTNDKVTFVNVPFEVREKYFYGN